MRWRVACLSDCPKHGLDFDLWRYIAYGGGGDEGEEMKGKSKRELNTRSLIRFRINRYLNLML